MSPSSPFFVESYNEIMIRSLTSTSLSKNEECCRVDDIIRNHDIETVKYILLSHAFSGSDTTSGIFNFGEKKIVKKFASPTNLVKKQISFIWIIQNLKQLENQQYSYFRIFLSLQMKNLSWRK